MSEGSKRLPGFSYVGQHAYLLTVCAFRHASTLTEPEFVQWIIDQFLRLSDEEEFAVHAYCAMPDHVHLVADGREDASDLRRLMHRWKTVTAHRWRQSKETTLWQRGYHDRVVRERENLPEVISYVIWNPVRAGLADRPSEYPFCGPQTAISASADPVGDRLPV